MINAILVDFITFSLLLSISQKAVTDKSKMAYLLNTQISGLSFGQITVSCNKK